MVKKNLLLSRPTEILLGNSFHQRLSSELMLSRISRFLFLPKWFVGHHDWFWVDKWKIFSWSGYVVFRQKELQLQPYPMNTTFSKCHNMIKDSVHWCGKEMESRCQDKFGKIFRQNLQAQKNVLSIKNEESYTFCEF